MLFSVAILATGSSVGGGAGRRAALDNLSTALQRANANKTGMVVQVLLLFTFLQQLPRVLNLLRLVS